MKFRPYGLYTEGTKNPPYMNAADFSNEHYEGVRCGLDRNERPVVIMHSKREAPLRWKVVYGFSSVFFTTFKEALDFCNSSEMRMVKENEDSHYV